ncbi:MAG: hypothetical protein ACI8XG_000496 [Congregibacter sp.]|jgi:hypothetical protein
MKKYLYFIILVFVTKTLTATDVKCRELEVSPIFKLSDDFVVENGIIRDKAFTPLNVISHYPMREQQLILRDQTLVNAINSGFAYSEAKTLSLHRTINNVFSTAAGSVSVASITGSEFSKLAPNVRRIIRIMNENQFNYLFYKHRAPYTYIDFIKASAKWPRFCGEMLEAHPFIDTADKDAAMDKSCKGEMASMFAHFSQEVGAHTGGEEWREGLYFVEEVGCQNGECNSYNAPCIDGTWTQFAYPCGTGATFHGRGAKQLTYSYNYGPFSRLIYGDFTLLNSPDRLAKEGFLTLASAIYFYMTPRSPKPSIHQTVTGLWLPTTADKFVGRNLGFGVQTLIINGGIECGKGKRTPQAANRASYFESFAKYFKIWNSWFILTEQHCEHSEAFANNVDSSTYYKGYIAKKWDGSCDYVAWEETGFNAFTPGDLQLCEQSVAEGVYPAFPATWIAPNF